jgi:hypothetical protein
MYQVYKTGEDLPDRACIEKGLSAKRALACLEDKLEAQTNPTQAARMRVLPKRRRAFPPTPQELQPTRKRTNEGPRTYLRPLPQLDPWLARAQH